MVNKVYISVVLRTKKELPVVECMDQGYVVTCAPNARDLRMRQPPCQYAYGQIRIRANTPTNTTPLLALHCHPNDPVAGTVLLPESDNCRANTPAIPIMVVPISLQPKHDQVELYSLKK